jgi:hypothetical protein
MAKRVTKVVKKSRVEKPFNHNSLSKAGFFGSIRAALRSHSRWWKPIAACKANAKRPYRGPNKLQKYEYQCNICKEHFSEKEIAVDHIVEAGSLKDFDDLPGFVQRLFCEVEGFQILCNKRKDGKVSCHSEKTQAYMKEQKEKAKKSL